MSDSSDSEVEVEEAPHILYDLVTYKEWEQEPEVLKSDRPQLWRGGRTAALAVPAEVERLRSLCLTWQLSVSEDANLVAVLGDSVLEIWSSRESYTQLVGRRPVERDAAPHWRHLLWSSDCSLLAMASSAGAVELCDTLGSHVYHLISPRIAASQPGWQDSARTGPVSTSYAGAFFTEVRLPDTRDTAWVSELVLVEVGGEISSFLVSLTGYQEMTRYSLGWSVTCVTVCHRLGLLITGGGEDQPFASKRSLVGRASHDAGLVTFRLVTQSPHYVPLLEREEQSLLTSPAWLKLPSIPFLSSTSSHDYILAMSVSQCGGRLAALHVSGSLSVWRLPSLVLESSSRLQEQPLFDEVNPALLQSSNKRKAKAEFLANPVRYHPVALAWWSEESVVLARVSGAVTVLRVRDNLDNILGDSPEFLEGVPRISQCFQKGFFALECDYVVRGRRVSTREESAGEDPEEDLELETDDEEEGWVTLGKRSAAALAYFITDSERFAPPKKKSKIVRRTYRMLALVSTSPEELYKRKILLEEYGEAIMLAQHYGLDTDSVYRRQWQNSNKSSAAIQDYLSKIKRRSEVIRECLETIPDDLDAARELLRYGMRATDLEALVGLGQGEGEEGRLVLSGQERDARERLRLLSQVRWESLTVTQKELLRTRTKLLYYLDCLDTLEDILGGGHLAAEKYSPAAFRLLRSHSPLENSARAAKQGDTITVDCLMSGRHATVISPHWLAVLSNFPETLSPSEYSSLLPSVESGVVSQLYRQEARAEDWCEGALAKKWGGPGVRRDWDTAVLYQQDSECLKQLASDRLTATEVSRWYGHRAKQIVTMTSLPDNGLALLTLGLERGATVDWQLLHNIRTLDCLVYEVQASHVSLNMLENMEILDQIDLLLRGHFTVLGVRRFLQPFLQRLEDGKPGEMKRLVSLYCVAKAADDLSFPLVVIENSGPDKTGPVLYSVVDTIRLALDCCYTNTTGNQMDLAEKIYLSILPYFKENPGTRQLKYNVSHMKQEVEMFKKHLEISRLLNKNGVVKPLAYIKENMEDSEAMKKLFDAVTARAEGSSLDQDGWRGVLRDLQKLQNLIPVVNIQGVMLSYTESLLSSGSHSNIALAGSVMEGLIETADSLRLIVTAWRHYYSSASGLHDPDLELARKCLSLAPDGVREIQDCYDLIAALQSLADFGLQEVLPVSVLQCQDRLEFVRRALQARPTAYKNTQRLMKLASLLRVCGGEGVEGEVWAAVARRALQVGDLSAAQTASNNFILAGYTKGWDICCALASQGNTEDIDQSRDLLAFAVSHCDQENIQDILQAFINLEQRKITHNIERSIAKENGTANDSQKDEEEEEEEVFDDAVSEAERESREVSPLMTVLNIPSLTSRYLSQHQVTPAVVWQQTSSWLSQLAQAPPSLPSSWSSGHLDTSFTSVSLPAFYLSDGGSLSVSGLDLCYDSYFTEAREQSSALTSHQILRLHLLSQSAARLREDQPADQQQEEPPSLELLCSALPLVASQDLYLGLGLLLSLPSDLAISSLSSLPSTLPALALSLTHLAILHLSSPSSLKSSPRRLVALALNTSDSSQTYSELVRHQELLTDYHQGHQLSHLAGEVDVERFTRDQEYKEDTILGLAMLTESETWSLTLSLARRYSLPLWSVYATHLQTLLTADLGADMARDMMQQRDILTVLHQDKERLQDWMVSRVLPLIDGHDVKMLLLYHQILGNDNTVEALTLIQQNDLRIDFALLETESRDILQYLSSDNIETFARVVKILGSSKITPSLLYRDWALKAFFQHGKSKDNWIEAFSVCQQYLDNVNPEDFKLFVKDCILSESTLKHIPKPARGRIFKKSVKFVEIKIAAKSEGDWASVELWLDQVKLHTEKMKKSSDVTASYEEQYSRELEMFEITGGDSVEIFRLVARMVLTDVDKKFISQIIQIWKEGENDGFLESLDAVIDQLTQDGEKITNDPFQFIEKICQLEVIPNSKLSLKLSPLCTNELVPVEQRLALVKTLKKLKVELEAEEDLDSSMLASLFETQHQIEKILPGLVVSKNDLETNFTKWKLFEKITNECNSSQQLLELQSLIGNWEGFESEFAEDREKNCVLKLSLKMFDLDNGKDIMKLFENFLSDKTVPSDVSQVLLDKCRASENRLLFIKTVLQLQLEEHYTEVLEMLPLVSPDGDTVRLIVLRGLVSDLVSSPAFHPLVTILAEEDQLAQEAVSQLRQAGHNVQAASIEGAMLGVPVGLRTLASVAQKIFSKK